MQMVGLRVLMENLSLPVDQKPSKLTLFGSVMLLILTDGMRNCVNNAIDYTQGPMGRITNVQFVNMALIFISYFTVLA